MTAQQTPNTGWFNTRPTISCQVGPQSYIVYFWMDKSPDVTEPRLSFKTSYDETLF